MVERLVYTKEEVAMAELDRAMQLAYVAGHAAPVVPRTAKRRLTGEANAAGSTEESTRGGNFFRAGLRMVHGPALGKARDQRMRTVPQRRAVDSHEAKPEAQRRSGKRCPVDGRCGRFPVTTTAAPATAATA